MKNKNQRLINIGLILTYNCANLVEDTFNRIPKNALEKTIIVDDGSKDNIVKIANKLKLPIYRHDHSGYGGNIKFGLQKALDLGADYIVEIHGDGQYDPSIIPQALKKIQNKCDFLLGSRFTNLKQAVFEDHMPLQRYFANILLSFISNFVLQTGLTEVHTGFRIYSKKLIKTIGFANTSNEHIYSFENIAQAKFYNLKISEIPIHCDYKKDHTSISIKKSVIYSLDMFRVMTQYLMAKTGIKVGIFKKN